jgi:hypothetical protein
MRISLIAISFLLLAACSRHDGGTRADSARDLARSVATGNFPADAAHALEAQLQRELFNAKDTGFVRGLHSCDEGGEEEPPPGLALARAAVIGAPVPSRDEPDAVTVRAVLTSVASTRHHEDGDQVDIDVDVGVRVDSVDFLMANDEGGYAICYTQLFLHRGALGWAVVRQWSPPNGTWAMVTRLADSVSRSPAK